MEIEERAKAYGLYLFPLSDVDYSHERKNVAEEYIKIAQIQRQYDIDEFIGILHKLSLSNEVYSQFIEDIQKELNKKH